MDRTHTRSEFAQPALEDEATSLPAWTYSDPDFFALEKEKVFLPAWQLVCHLSDLPEPGDYQTFPMMGELALIVRGKDGVVRAFHNVCRHRAARLIDGEAGNCGRQIVCPYHAWTYQLDGKLTGVPNLEDYENFDRADHGLAPIELEIFGGFVFIRFRSGGPGLADYMEPVAEEISIYRTTEMQPLRRVGNRIREVNWKNATDNYVDALHVPVAHTGLNDQLGSTYKLTIDRGAHKIFGDIRNPGAAFLSNKTYRKYLPRFDHLPEERQTMWTYWKLWPAMMFDVYPEQIDFMQFIPLTPTSCLLRESAYGLPDERRETRAVRYLNWRINRIVNLEDKELIERVQAGMGSSSFTAGPFGKSEICLRDFARQMRETIPLARHDRKPDPETVAAAFGD